MYNYDGMASFFVTGRLEFFGSAFTHDFFWLIYLLNLHSFKVTGSGISREVLNGLSSDALVMRTAMLAQNRLLRLNIAALFCNRPQREPL
jgi:hypothetical protein